ncbi:MAG: potassium channel family protein [Gammaproteobacteria bacterium]|nr:potassium channel family protein [Gammaproteobacteria bacterium]
MLVTSLVICTIVAACVMVHYEFLYQMTRLIPRLNVRHRLRIVLGVIGALIAHSVEIWIFALGYYWLHHAGHWGQLRGNYDGSLLASGYYSFTTFTTLGYGDIEPFGGLRYLSGIESLVGLLLITWSASFLYIEMTRYWDPE